MSNLESEYLILECVGCGANLTVSSNVEIDKDDEGICIVIRDNKTLRCEKCGKRYMRKVGGSGAMIVNSGEKNIVIAGDVRGAVIGNNAKVTMNF